MTVFEELERNANFARKGYSRDLVYETYGMAKMAYKLGAITWDQFKVLNTILIVEGINNLRVSKLY